MFLAIVLAQAVTAFTPIPDSLPHLLYGYFQSCPDVDAVDDGYGELAYEHTLNGKVRWTLHLGPRDEWGLYVGAPAEHLRHDSVFNRLAPAYHYGDVKTRVGGRNWSALGLHLNVIRVPTSDEACYGFLVKITADPMGKWASR